jgi:hypothetical protein
MPAIVSIVLSMGKARSPISRDRNETSLIPVSALYDGVLKLAIDMIGSPV